MIKRPHKAAPTHSRGRPALPVYRWGRTLPGCYRSVVDSSVVVDNSETWPALYAGRAFAAVEEVEREGGGGQLITHARNAAPTHSRGRPALPVYRLRETWPGCYWRVVDSSVVVDKSGVAR
jgi:hypothetical protein